MNALIYWDLFHKRHYWGSCTDGNKVLEDANRSGKTQIVQWLMTFLDIFVNNATRIQVCTALIIASLNADSEVVGLLLTRYDINVNTVDGYGRTALIIASLKGHTEIVSLLVSHPGINVNKMSEWGSESTALIIASLNGHTEIVRLLLSHPGINVNKMSTIHGYTALIIACQKGLIEIVRLLLAHRGIDVNKAMTIYGYTALKMASQKGHTEIVRLLLTHPAIDVNKASFYKITALVIAILNDHTEIVRMLLAHRNIERISSFAINVFADFRAFVEFCLCCFGGRRTPGHPLQAFGSSAYDFYRSHIKSFLVPCSGREIRLFLRSNLTAP